MIASCATTRTSLRGPTGEPASVWRTSTAGNGAGWATSWTGMSRSADAGTSMPTTAATARRWRLVSGTVVDILDDLDREVMAAISATATGAAPSGLWATDRAGALRRLDRFVDVVLPDFGAHEDAMLRNDWHLAHSLLSPYLNIGLLLPGEVCDAVEAAYRAGRVPSTRPKASSAR